MFHPISYHTNSTPAAPPWQEMKKQKLRNWIPISNEKKKFHFQTSFIHSVFISYSRSFSFFILIELKKTIKSYLNISNPHVLLLLYFHSLIPFIHSIKTTNHPSGFLCYTFWYKGLVLHSSYTLVAFNIHLHNKQQRINMRIETSDI